jgi:hypothetical protein
MLVVSNAYLNPHIRPLIPEGEFIHSLERTILLLERLSPMSPVFKKNMEVLRHAKRDVFEVYNKAHAGEPPLPLYDQQQYGREYEQNNRREYGQAQSPGRSHSYSHQPHPSQSYSAAHTPAAHAPSPRSQLPPQLPLPPPQSSEPPPQQQAAASSQQQWPARSYSVSYSPPGGPATPGTPQFSGGSSAAPPATAPATAGAGNGGGERAERDRASGGPLSAPSFSAPQR